METAEMATDSSAEQEVKAEVVAVDEEQAEATIEIHATNDITTEVEDDADVMEEAEEHKLELGEPDEDANGIEVELEVEDEFLENAEESQENTEGADENEADAIIGEERDEEREADEEHESVAKEVSKDEDDDDDDEEDDDEEDDDSSSAQYDSNVMPQVNVQILAKRKWQVKVYPLKPADFMSGNIARVFKNAKESLLYLISAGKYARGKGEMYISSVNQTLRVVQGLMKRDCHFPEINIEIVKKNGEGAVEEKAYMRFDSKMVRMLFAPPNPSWSVYGRKRERLIGSVFVKNLPPSTTKDMLRVMFPFAQEINYNPEKFKEGTARLVLKARSTVIPCLKAFAKVELGGHVLELHPLEKKRQSDDEDPNSESRDRSRSTSVKDDDKKEEDSYEESRKDKGKSRDESGGKDTASTKRNESDKSSSQDRKKSEETGSRQNSSKKPVARRGTDDKTPNRSRSAKDRNASWSPERSRKSFSTNDSRGGFSKNDTRGSRRGGARLSGRGRSRNFDGGSGRNFGTRGRGGRGGFRGQSDRRYGPSARNITDDPMNTEATKDMLVLQNQLSMAIKSQLAMLNQTKMAVEQAKIGASGLGVGARGSSSTGMLGRSEHRFGQLSPDQDLDRGYGRRGSSREHREQGARGYGQKRKAQQAGLRQVNERGYGKRPYKGGASRARGKMGQRSNFDTYHNRDSNDYRQDTYARSENQRTNDQYPSTSYSYGGSGGYGDYGYGGY